MREDLREIGPHVMIAPPRFWEAMCSEYQVKIDDAGLFKRAAARVALAIGERVAAKRLAAPPQRVGPALRLLGVAYLLVTFRAHAGQARAVARPVRLYRRRPARRRRSSSSSAPSASTSSRCTARRRPPASACCTPTARSAPRRSASPRRGRAIRISDAGEILISSESVFLGYYKNPDATAQRARRRVAPHRRRRASWTTTATWS